MKVKWFPLVFKAFLFCQIWWLISCLDSPGQSTQIFLPEKAIGFTFPEIWEPSEDMGPFDLRCFNGSAYFNTFLYYPIDLSKGQAPYEIYQLQTDDLLSRRDNVEKIGDEKQFDLKDKHITLQMYSAEKEGIKNYYYSTLVEFKEEDSPFLWVLFTSVPSYALEHQQEWEEILKSGEFNK